MSASTRWTIYCLFFIATGALMTTRVMLVKSASGRTPFLSANDRSRWLTIRALGDHNTYEIDNVLSRELELASIDSVKHKGADGRQHLYSSKPPLLPTLMAYEYLALKNIAALELTENPFVVARVLLITFNVIPVLVICILIALMAESYCETNWTRIYIVACACFGTYLCTFAVTLNNHIPAALGAAVGIFALARIWIDDSKSYALYFVAGLGAAWAAANELPALSFLAVAITATLIKSVPKALLGTCAGAAVVAIGFFSTNMIAHGDWIPPYAHRRDGATIAELDPQFESLLDEGIKVWQPNVELIVPDSLREEIRQKTAEFGGLELSANTKLLPGRTALKKDVVDRWVIHDMTTETFFAITKSNEGALNLRLWDNWYEYEGSYWLEGNRSGVDLGEKSISNYAMHIFVGHHGIFSLTPIWLLAAAGMIITLANRDNPLFWIVVAIIILSVVVVGFYLARPEIDRNYGGVSCVLRWLLWLSPLWLVCILAAGDQMFTSTLMKVIAVILLIGSFASSLTAFLNPWQHPWLYYEMVQRGWINPF